MTLYAWTTPGLDRIELYIEPSTRTGATWPCARRYRACRVPGAANGPAWGQTPNLLWPADRSQLFGTFLLVLSARAHRSWTPPHTVRSGG